MAEDLRKVRLTDKKDLPSNFKIHTDIKRWNPWQWIPILNRYIFLEIVGPFFISLSFFTFIYTVMALQKMVGLIVGKGVDPFRLLDYLGYTLGNTLPSTIPMACLMGGIMAAGRLSGDSEITAMRSAGISFTKIYFNFLIFGLIMTIIVGYMNFKVGPENTKKMNEFNTWIVAYNPLLAVNPGQFSGDTVKDNFESRGRTLYTDDINSETGEMYGIQIREWELYEGGNDYISHNNMIIPMGGSRITQIISAKSGIAIEKLNESGEYERAIRLKNGFIIEWNEKKDGFTVTNFLNGEMDYRSPSERKSKKSMTLNVKPETFTFLDLIRVRDNIESNGFEDVPGLEMLKDYGISIKGVRGFKTFIDQIKMEIVGNKNLSPEELSLKFSLMMQMESLYKDSERVLAQFNVEIHKRIAGPISCQIFFFLSFPLGLVVKRSGKGMSFSLAIIFLFLYYAIFIFGSGISLKSNVPDWIGPWMANITMGCISVYIMISRTDIQVKQSLPFKILMTIFYPLIKLFEFSKNKINIIKVKIIKKNNSSYIN